jgi:hypothetical protein
VKKIRSIFHCCLRASPILNASHYRVLRMQNIRHEEDLVDQLFNSSEKRLARVLLMLAHFGKEGVPETVVPKISQETLAEMVGTTPFAGELFHETGSGNWHSFTTPGA